MSRANISCGCGANLEISGESLEVALRTMEFNKAYRVCREAAKEEKSSGAGSKVKEAQ